MGSDKIRAISADDHKFVGEGMRELLQRGKDLEVVVRNLSVSQKG